MEDLTTMLSQVLGDPQAMQQIGALAASLGLTGTTSAPEPSAPPPQTAAPDLSALSGLFGSLGSTQPEAAAPASGAGGLDLSALSGLLGGLGGTQPEAAAPAPATAAPDLSALSGILGSLGGTQQPPKQSGGADLSALTALLGGGRQSAPGGGSGGFPFDINTLLKLQKAMSSITENKANVDLLLALKPRLKAERAKKVDDAIRVMQLVQFLPLIKESGLFGDMEKILGGLGSGGLGGVLGNLFGGKK